MAEARPARSKSVSLYCSFTLDGYGRDLSAGAGIKVFWFFSSEKNFLLPFIRLLGV
jgi:hypothetical protein